QEVDELKNKVITLENKKGEQIEAHPVITQNLNMSLLKDAKADVDEDAVKQELIDQLFTK
ncbi:hypothetical protein F2K62_004259, partial [Vibrio fluvialis]|nr:hypothetical protein [Vibrio fluvialis]